MSDPSTHFTHRVRSSQGSSSTAADTASTADSTSGTLPKPERKRTYIKDRAVHVRRDRTTPSPEHADLADVTASARGSGDPRRLKSALKKPVVIDQPSLPQSPTGVRADAPGRFGRHSDPQSAAQRPLSGYSVRSYSPTFSTSSAEPLYDLRSPAPRSPAVVTDARSSPVEGPRNSSRGSSTPDKYRPGQMRYYQHARAESSDQASQRERAEASSAKAAVADSPTDIEDVPTSDLDVTTGIEPGLARYQYRQKMRQDQSQQRRDANKDDEIEHLRERLASLEADNRQHREDLELFRQQQATATHVAQDKPSRRLSRTTTFSMASETDRKGKARVEGHRIPSGDVIRTQASRPRSDERESRRYSVRSTAPTTPIRDSAIVDDDDDDKSAEDGPRASQEQGKRRHRRKHRRQHSERS